MNRRTCVKLLAGAAAGTIAPAANSAFFRTAKRGDRWWLLTPAGEPFFSIGMNHIDSSALRYPESGTRWSDRYDNSEEKWVRSVAANLRDWGFNTAGWVQEVVIRNDSFHRHSPAWSFEQYQWLGMPYCHLLPFAETHQWEVETRLPDFFSKDFEEWCDYVARHACTRMADDPKLIGYFYVDCPVWAHPGLAKWRGPLFDPKKLQSQAGRDELFALASRYYKVTHDAIRRYDKNHLILGDRYEAKAALPDQVLLAANPYVDIMSFQFFAEPAEITAGFQRFHQLTGKPVLLADAAVPGRAKLPLAGLGPRYAAMVGALRDANSCVGWHVCGAYAANRARKYGFLDENEQGSADFLSAVKQANRETAEWARRAR